MVKEIDLCTITGPIGHFLLLPLLWLFILYCSINILFDSLTLFITSGTLRPRNALPNSESIVSKCFNNVGES